MDSGEFLMPGSLNKETIKNFWRDRAGYDESRWTSNEMLEFERMYLDAFLPPSPITILDIGSGSGQLSKSIKRLGDKLIAVDQEVGFQKYFVGDDMEFIHCNAADFKFEKQADLILLFGVINYLTDQEISEIFTRVAYLPNRDLQFIVKAQFAINEHYGFDKFSSELNFQYSARYLKFDSFLNFLEVFKKRLEIIEYPPGFNQKKGFVHKAIRIYEK
jgi:SAM-dependent methyltransferase